MAKKKVETVQETENTEQSEENEEVETKEDTEQEKTIVDIPEVKEILGEFTIRKDNSRILKSIVETMASIIDEGYISVDKKELSISAMDPSRICLFKLSIKKQDFDDFKVKKPAKISINFDDLDKILKRSNAKDSIELSFNSDEQKLKIKMKPDEESNSRVRTFSLTLLDIEYEEVPLGNLENLEYSATWIMDPDFFNEAIKDAEIYSEILNIKAKENNELNFTSTGQIGEMNYDLTLEEESEPTVDEECKGSYSLTFLKSILKLKDVTEKLEISLKTDHPLKLKFSILEGGDAQYYLAPRCEEPDFEDDDDFDSF